MKKGLWRFWCLGALLLIVACGGQEENFANTMIGDNADYAVPTGEITALDPADDLVVRAAPTRLITAPYRPHDPTIPHPAYNGHPTTFKAISRGVCDQVYFRWDLDGNGTWDTCDGRSYSVMGANGFWYKDNRYLLDCRNLLPVVDPAVTKRKLFIATIEATCAVDGSGASSGSRYASYYVMVYADVPQGRPAGSVPIIAPAPGTTYAYSARPPVTDTTCNTGTNKCVETGFHCTSNAHCVGDTSETLKIKREVAIDDAIWYLHKQMSRSGEGTNSITGQIPASSYDSYVLSSAVFLHALALTGHFNAYPPSTYVHGSFADVPALPTDWTTKNDQRYNNDPYAEDASRLLNYLLTYLSTLTITAASEENDGRTPIPGTDNLSGLRTGNDSNMNLGQILAAFVANGSPGISVQATGLAGHSLGYVAQEIIDAACYYQQTGADASGGFFYGGQPSTTNLYWSTNTFALYEGMANAEKMFTGNDLLIPNACKHRVANHVLLATAANGHGKLSNHASFTTWSAPGWTGMRLLAAGWLGIDTLPYDSNTSFSPESGNTNTQLIDNLTLAKTMIGTDWNTPAANSNWRTGPENRFDGTGRGNVFAWVSFAKGARALNTPLTAYPGTSGDIDWFTDLSYIAINSQHRDGYLYTDDAYDHYNELSEFSNHSISIPVRTAWGIIHTLSSPLIDPVAFASASPLTTVEGCTGGINGKVTFNHSNSYHENPDRHIVSYRWLFDVTGDIDDAFASYDWGLIGDGEYSTDGKAYHTTVKDATPIYTYQYDGTYTAALQVIDDATPAATDIMPVTITVTAQAEVDPTTDAKGPYVMATGEPLMLHGTMSDGNSVCSPGDTLTAEWYLNDDTVPFFTGITGTLTWDELAALYPGLPDATPIPLVLKVTDGTGRTDESATTLTLGIEVGPTACFSATPLTVGCGGPVSFDAGCSTHPHAARSISLYEWQWDHDTDYVGQDPETFPFTPDEEGVTAVHTYLSAGTHRATLRLTDDHNLHGIAQKVVTVTITTKPTAIPGGPYTIDEGQGLTLDGSGSFDPDTACGDAIVTYAWDLDHDDIFDDCFGELCVISDAQSVAFGWHEGNTYAIALKVTDSTGKVSNVSETTIKVDSVCGNNFKAPSEECDDGNNEDGDCCAAGCTFEIIGASCGDGATVCSAQDTCDGAGLCLPNHLSGTPCTDDDLFCTGAETCTDGICGSAGDPCGVDLFCDEDMDACINSREEQCDIDNGNPPNSSDTIANVTIRYTTAGGWTSPADCAWGCNADYAEDGVSLDTSFDPDVNGDVWSIALQPDGKILLGGDFTAVGGVARNHIARLNADGTLDTTFDPNANGTVYAIAAQPDGGVLVGGAFTTIGGETRHYLARLGDDGLLDTTFDPEPNDWVMFIAAPSDGTILVGGAFHTIGGQAMKFMARLNADGTADASFDPALNSTVFFITTQTDGKILVGGTFTSAGIETRNHIARLNADGTLDTTFDPGEVNGDVYSLAVQADGMILVSGGFTAIGGETRNHLARLNEDGLLDTTFDPDPNNYTVSIALQTDGKVLASGFFTSLGGQTRNGIARLNIDGTVDTTIDPDANGTVRFVAVQPDGKILAGGAFTAIGGQPRNRMARINPDALCINSKEVPCDTDNGNPENSSDTIANVTITYSTAGGWTLPADCAWTCDTDFALEDGACINEKQVPCDTDNDNPENSSDTIANVTILYTTDGGWELPADCAWTCDTDFALEGGDCINQKEVPCDEDNGNPVNSSDIIANVTIHYTTEGGWELPADCDWACDTDFAEEGGACINQKDVSCDEDNGNPVNSSNTIADVTIHYTTDGGWELPPDCAWTCDDGFFLNGEATACVECFVDGDCADGNACNGEELCDDLGLCNAGEPLVCADDNACTDDQCDPSAGCQYIDDDTNICDDGNELTENDVCFQGDCAGTLMAGVCGNAIPVGALPYTTTGTTASRPNSLEDYGAGCAADKQATADVVYELAVEEGVEYQIQVVPTDGGDLALNLLGVCGAGEPCIDAANGGGAGETEVIIGVAGQSGTVYIAIEGSGAYELSIGVVEQPDDDTVEPDDILPDEAVTDETLVDEIVVDEEEPDEMVIDDVATDDILIDKEETDDAPVILDDGTPLADDTVTPDDGMPQDKDTPLPDTDIDSVMPHCGDGTTNGPEFCDDGSLLNGTCGHCNATCTGYTACDDADNLLDDEDSSLPDDIDTDKPADNGCGCSLVF